MPPLRTPALVSLSLLVLVLLVPAAARLMPGSSAPWPAALASAPLPQLAQVPRQPDVRPGDVAPPASHNHYVIDSNAQGAGPAGQLAPRLQNLGPHTFAVTTASSRAQMFISQGLNLAYAFNHAEAGRAFREAARLDPGCVMA